MAGYSINVKQFATTSLKVEVEGGMTIGELREKLATLAGVPAKELKLIFKGKIFKCETDTLEASNIVADSTVHTVHIKPQISANAQPQPALSTAQAPPQITPSSNNFAQQDFASAMPGLGNPNPLALFGGMGNQGGFGNTGNQGGFGNTGNQGGFGNTGNQGGFGNTGGDEEMTDETLNQLMSIPYVRNLALRRLSDPAEMRQVLQENPQLRPLLQLYPGIEYQLGNRAVLDRMFPNSGFQPGQPNTGAPQTNFPGFGGSGQNTNHEELYQDQLKTLGDMGFTSREVNLRVLKDCYGDLDAAVERLLNIFK